MNETILPEGWSNCTFADIAEVNPKKIKAEQNLNAGFIPMSHAPMNYNGKLEFEEKTWSEIGKSYTNFKNDDVIFAKVTPCFENGKAAIVKNMPNGIGAGSSEFYVLRARNKEIPANYLLGVIKTKKFMQEGAENMTGAVGLRRVPKAFVESFPLILPPVAEQKVIAEKLDTLLAQVDSAKARLEQIPQILKRFRQSVLSAAVSGKLTEEWREERLLTIDDWLITCVGNIAQVATGKTPKRTEPKYWDNGSISWLTSSSTGNSITTSAEQFVTELALKECTLKLFGPGTLLLAMYGEGKTRGQVTELKLNAACNQACAAIIVIEEKVHRSFMKIRLMENYEETRKTAVGGNQPNLNLNKVREISINLPSLEEQAQIVNRVGQLFAYADTIEKQVQAALLRVNNLTQSILAKAFRGELTAQWRAENPDLINGENSAEALLVRIKQERLKNKPVKRGKGNS